MDALVRLRARHEVAVEAPGVLGLLQTFGDAAVLQQVDLSEVAGRLWIRILVPVGPAFCMPAEAALEHNLTLAAGALARDGEMLVLKALLPASLDDDALDLALSLMAREAIRLRWKLVQPALTVAPSSLFAD